MAEDFHVASAVNTAARGERGSWVQVQFISERPLVNFSKSSTATIRDALQQEIAVASAMATYLKGERLAGRFASAPEKYSQRATSGPRKHKGYYISPAYATALGLKNDVGQPLRLFRSSASFHAQLPGGGSIAGAGRVTGGMWRGLNVRNFGSHEAIAEFTGSSLGGKSVLGANTRATKDAEGKIVHKQATDRHGKLLFDKKGNPKMVQVREIVRDKNDVARYRTKPQMIRNNVKAAAVFRHSKVGLLQPTEHERQTVLLTLSHQMGLAVFDAFGGVRFNTTAPAHPLAGAIMREFRK